MKPSNKFPGRVIILLILTLLSIINSTVAMNRVTGTLKKEAAKLGTNLQKRPLTSSGSFGGGVKAGVGGASTSLVLHNPANYGYTNTGNNGGGGGGGKGGGNDWKNFGGNGWKALFTAHLRAEKKKLPVDLIGKVGKHFLTATTTQKPVRLPPPNVQRALKRMDDRKERKKLLGQGMNVAPSPFKNNTPNQGRLQSLSHPMRTGPRNPAKNSRFSPYPTSYRGGGRRNGGRQ